MMTVFICTQRAFLIGILLGFFYGYMTRPGTFASLHVFFMEAIGAVGGLIVGIIAGVISLQGDKSKKKSSYGVFDIMLLVSAIFVSIILPNIYCY